MLKALSAILIIIAAAGPAAAQTMESLICDHHLPYWYEARETASDAERLAFVEQTIERYEEICGITRVETELPDIEVMSFGSPSGDWSARTDSGDFDALDAWAERAYRANVPSRRSLTYGRCDRVRMIEITMTAVCRMDSVQAQLPNSLEIIAGSVNGGAFLNLARTERSRRAMKALSAAIETDQYASSAGALTETMGAVLECLDDHATALHQTPQIRGPLLRYYEAATLTACSTNSSY